MRMKMGILNLSKSSQVTKTSIEGVQNQRNLYLVTIHSLIQKGTATHAQHSGQIYEKMPLHGNLALYRNDRQMHRGGA